MKGYDILKQIIPFKQELLFKTKVSEITSISLEHTLSLKEEDIISGEFLITGDYKMTEGSINREKFSFNLPFEITLDSGYNTEGMIIDIDNFYYEVVNNEYLKVNIDVYIEGEKKQIPEPQSITIEEINMDIENSEIKTEEEEERNIKRNEDEERTKKNESEVIVLPPSQEDITIVGEYNKNVIEKNLDHTKVDKELELIDNEDNNIIINNTTNKTISLIDNKIKDKKKTEVVNVKDNYTINNEFNIFENIDNSDTYVTYHVYIVKDEDNIDTIIEKYGVEKEEIANYNDITQINPGDKIVIPNKNE